jgi:histone H2A
MSQSSEHKKRHKDRLEKKKSKASRAGLTFPPSRFQKRLKSGAYAPRIGFGAGLYMAAIIEYLCAEVLELAGNAAKDNARSRVSPRHVMLAVRNDDELNRLLDRVHIANSGVIPSVHRILLHTLEQRRKLQQKGELPSDTILCSQLTPEIGIGIGDLDKKRRTADEEDDSRQKKKRKTSSSESDYEQKKKKDDGTKREKKKSKKKSEKKKSEKSSDRSEKSEKSEKSSDRSSKSSRKSSPKSSEKSKSKSKSEESPRKKRTSGESHEKTKVKHATPKKRKPSSSGKDSKSPKSSQRS